MGKNTFKGLILLPILSLYPGFIPYSCKFNDGKTLLITKKLFSHVFTASCKNAGLPVKTDALLGLPHFLNWIKKLGGPKGRSRRPDLLSIIWERHQCPLRHHDGTSSGRRKATCERASPETVHQTKTFTLLMSDFYF